MLEKEIKILEVDTSEIIDKLLSLWAEKTFEGHVRDVYFDFHNRVENKKEEAEKIYRLRQKWEKNVYTVKHKKYLEIELENVMVKEEVETWVANFDDFSKMLEMQWMTAIRKKEKYRASYVLNDIVFDFDTYNGIPTVLEIEWPSGDKIYDWIKKLLLHEKELLVWGSRMLFDRYQVPYTYC
jgi:predicted adenylyl cyclase CyaB